jgi:CDP-glycerol glycerophosphotransferase (TagB/SpsB family)
MQILQRWAAKGATVDEGNNAWRDFLVASDVAIADHSSLALYHALLGHPLIFIPVPAGEYVEASAFEVVSKTSVGINDVSELSPILEGTEIHCTMNEVTLDLLVEHRDCSERRHIEEIRELLR